MSRLRVVDRVVVVVVGLALVAAGAVVLDFSLDLVGNPPDRVDVGPVRDVTGTGWWPYALAGGGVVIALAALAWLLAHLGRRVDPDVRLTPSGPTGRLVVDLDSVARAAAAQLASLAAVSRSRGSVVRGRQGPVVSVRAHVAGQADLAALLTAADEVAASVAAAFPQDDVGFRLVLDGPRAERSTTRRRDAIRVREDVTRITATDA